MNSLAEMIWDDQSLCEAIEYDLIRLGLRLRWLGTAYFDWRDLKVVVLQSDRTSAQFRQRHPDDEAWGIPEHLLARAVEALEWLKWAKTKDGRHNRNHPEPIYRPGVEKPEDQRQIGDVTTALTTEEMDAWLGWSPTDNRN